MKIIFKLIFIIYLLPLSIHAQRGARIAYIDMDVILSKNKEFGTANNLLDEKISQWKKEIELKKIKLKQIQDQFVVEKILPNPELIDDRELEIKDFASEIISLQEKRFGPNGDMDNPKKSTIKASTRPNIVNCSSSCKRTEIRLVFDRSSDIIMLYSAKNYDISDLVLKRIQAQERIKERKEKN